MQKMKSKKGFTLIEMLIVVGIIAILVAVSIPMVSSSLERAKAATDAANERAAKAAAMIQFLSGTDTSAAGAGAGSGSVVGTDGSINGIYDAIEGNIKTSVSTDGYGKCKTHKGGYIHVTVTDEGLAYMEWITSGTSAGTALTENKNIHGIDVDKEINSGGGSASP